MIVGLALNKLNHSLPGGKKWFKSYGMLGGVGLVLFGVAGLYVDLSDMESWRSVLEGIGIIGVRLRLT